MQDMSKDELILAFDMDTGKCNTCMLSKITKKPFQKVKPKTEILELIHSNLCDLYATPLLENRKYFVTFIDDASRFCYVYLLHTKDEAKDSGVIGEGCRAVVRLPDLKLKTLGERGIECIFVGYVEHYKDFSFYAIEPNELVSIYSIIELSNTIFDENRFSLVPRPSLRIPNGTKDTGGSVDGPKTFDEATKSQDVAFWKEAINDEMDFIIGNNTWVLADLPPVALISTIRLLIALASIHSILEW
ncbi:zinc finger, CCHC-type containing protein [Tanacetum coccineum]|uniref:Zinc finger, CCHC-type containing protein n=1 Tax=Tanacetum coccineum TaxID=301880 RepID=A0ABQ5J6G3_9ASTR